MSTEVRRGLVERLIRRSSARAGLALVLVLAGSALGTTWLRDLPRDVFPDLSTPVFNVIAQNPAMGPEELETAIAIPLEVALAGLSGIRRVRSTSQFGVVQVVGQLPPGTDAPLVSSLTGRLNEIFELTLEAEPGVADLMTLRDLAEFEVKNRLLAVPGVAAVDRLGGYLRQYQVQLDPERMAARAVTLDEVLHAVDGANVNAAGGFVVQGATEWTVRGVGRVTSPEELRETVVA